MSKRAWLILVCIVLAATATVGGTLAFLTDRDTVKNVFTLGNVDIKIDENFEQNKELYPNATVFKRAGITNTHATEPAYVWMVVSVPDALAKYITLGWADDYTDDVITEGVESPHEGYKGYLVKYPNILTAGSSTGDILKSIKLSEHVDYQGGKYVAVTKDNEGKIVTTEINVTDQVQKIFVDAYAIQTDGFADVDAAYTGYTGQWGGLNGGDSGYVKPSEPDPVVAHSQKELQDFINAATKDTVIVMAGDIEGIVNVPQNPNVHITIRGQGATFDGMLIIDGKSKPNANAGLTIENVHFTAEALPKDKPAKTEACINLGISGNTNTRYTKNVTVRNCTFDVPDAPGIKSYTGGDENLNIINCTATSRAHSLVQIANATPVVVENCIIKSKNGMNFNNTTDVTIRNCKDVDVSGYAVRFGAGDNEDINYYANGDVEKYLIEDCVLKSANKDGKADSVIVLRGSADKSELTIKNTMLEGEKGYKIYNHAADVTVIIDDVTRSFDSDYLLIE